VENQIRNALQYQLFSVMIEASTVMGPDGQHSTRSLQPQTEQVLRMRYHDIAKLQEGLDEIYGKGQYKLKAGNTGTMVHERHR
jgi:hypothetical protein